MKTVIIFVVFFLISCGGKSTFIAPEFHFEGAFKPSSLDKLEGYIKQLAQEKDYRVYEKRRHQMKTLTNGQDAFSIALYQKTNDKNILYISNTGAGTILTLYLFTNKDFSLQEAKSLADTVIHYLESQLNIEMKLIELSSE